MLRAISLTLTVGATLTLAACANGDALFGVDSSTPTAALPAKPAVDPACTVLAARIDGLRREGVVDRVEAAAKGRSTTVNIKRASLGQIAELEKTNAEFQAKCSTVPRSAAAAAPPAKAAQAGAETVATASVSPTAVAKPTRPASSIGVAPKPASPKQ